MRKIVLAAILLVASVIGNAQSVGINTNTPDASAALDISSTNKGVLVPRMTKAQRDAIVNPATGLMVYQTDNTPGFYYNAGTPASKNWTAVGSTSASSGGIQIFNATSGAGGSTIVNSVNITTIIASFGGASAAGSIINITLPAASSYPAGSSIRIAASAYTTSNPSWNITSAGSTYNALGQNNVSMNAVSLGSVNAFTLVTDGVSKWFRLP